MPYYSTKLMRIMLQIKTDFLICVLAIVNFFILQTFKTINEADIAAP
jgi:hypothetical protein